MSGPNSKIKRVIEDEWKSLLNPGFLKFIGHLKVSARMGRGQWRTMAFLFLAPGARSEIGTPLPDPPPKKVLGSFWYIYKALYTFHELF